MSDIFQSQFISQEEIQESIIEQNFRHIEHELRQTQNKREVKQILKKQLGNIFTIKRILPMTYNEEDFKQSPQINILYLNNDHFINPNFYQKQTENGEYDFNKQSNLIVYSYNDKTLWQKKEDLVTDPNIEIQYQKSSEKGIFQEYGHYQGNSFAVGYKEKANTQNLSGIQQIQFLQKAQKIYQQSNIEQQYNEWDVGIEQQYGDLQFLDSNEKLMVYTFEDDYVLFRSKYFYNGTWHNITSHQMLTNKDRILQKTISIDIIEQKSSDYEAIIHVAFIIGGFDDLLIQGSLFGLQQKQPEEQDNNLETDIIEQLEWELIQTTFYKDITNLSYNYNNKVPANFFQIDVFNSQGYKVKKMMASHEYIFIYGVEQSNNKNFRVFAINFQDLLGYESVDISLLKIIDNENQVQIFLQQTNQDLIATNIADIDIQQIKRNQQPYLTILLESGDLLNYQIQLQQQIGFSQEEISEFSDIIFMIVFFLFFLIFLKCIVIPRNSRVIRRNAQMPNQAQNLFQQNQQHQQNIINNNIPNYFI
ncbi:hypothetical protein PPERSA_00807 [Pseudocohnilembus persalinus]|uniref:Transmembrane protein n=1 Tax=Pseudocohnilembus persalinus TaxID=266149 RepID=A0A0V0QFQ9_PSEPJ|nr:hypothetical protein PPERSA_00807 [Pseudocohnilembus persalinus]|eukprot:KRX01059.1 hypothetical protein PPERSA_00807 [Pseudocohnilembus persalinus]